MAGYCGMAAGLLCWAKQKLLPVHETNYGPIHSFPSRQNLHSEVHQWLDQVGRIPKVVILGRSGRAGSGAYDYMHELAGEKMEVSGWGRKEIAALGGPPLFCLLEKFDIIVNCMLLDTSKEEYGQRAAYITQDMLEVPLPQRRASLLVDVSCDLGNPFNPFPVADVATTFVKPTVRVSEPYFVQNKRLEGGRGVPFDVMGIDHLPALLPKESSEFFGERLLPLLLNLKNEASDPVWQRARKVFNDKVQEMDRIRAVKQ